MKFFPRKNGNVIVDAIIEDVTVDGLKSLAVEKCPNVYSNALDEKIYEGLSLRDIFESGNLVVNGDFSDGTTGWTPFSSTLSNVNNNLITTSTVVTNSGFYQTLDLLNTLNDKIYVITSGKIIDDTNSNGMYVWAGKDGLYNLTNIIAEDILFENVFLTSSNIFTNDESTGYFTLYLQHRRSADGIGKTMEFDYIYALNLTTLFTTAPSKAQLDEWLALYLYLKNAETSRTGSEIVESLYINYDNLIAHNLTTIYGAGNEPSLATHEALIPQYTNTVLKAKAFANTLQQEYMQMSLDTPIYEGLSLRDIFESGVIFSDTFITDLSDYNISYLSGDSGVVDNQLKLFSTSTSFVQKLLSLTQNESYYISFKTIVNRYVSGTLGLRFNIGASTQFTLYSSTTIGTHTTSNIITNTFSGIDNIWFGNSNSGNADVYYDNLFIIPMSLFTIAPSQAQLDEWLDMYLTLTSNTTNTGTEFYQDRYYVDYDNAKVYDYNKIATYVATTPEDIQVFMAQLLDKTITLTSIPEKMWIEKDRVVILGSYTIVGE